MAWKCQMCSESLWWLISIRWDNVRASVAACTDLEIWRREANTKFEMWRIWKLRMEKDNNTKTYKNTPTESCVVWMTWKWWREKAAEQIPAEENNWQWRKLAACAAVEVICNCIEVELVHKWIDRVYWKCIDWLYLLACTAQYLAVDLPGRGRRGDFRVLSAFSDISFPPASR